MTSGDSMASFQVRFLLESPDRLSLPSWSSTLLGFGCEKRIDVNKKSRIYTCDLGILKMKLQDPGTQVVFHIFPRKEEFVSTYESVAFHDQNMIR